MKSERKRVRAVVGVVFVATLFGSPPAGFAEQGQSDGALVRMFKQAKLPLEGGLAVSLREGTPISGKYELNDDNTNELQLSVYTMQGGSTEMNYETGEVSRSDPTFAEVIVDHTTGEISKVIQIKDGEDLTAARIQSKAMAQARRSLEDATVQVVKAHNGYRAVSAIPDFKDGHPVVKVTLVNDSELKTVLETLD